MKPKRHLRRSLLLLNKIILLIYIKLRQLLHFSASYKVGKYMLLLPSEALYLPYYQKFNKAYDKFLSQLAIYIREKTSVIDVGAHYGDTLSSMITTNRKLKYYAIEADKTYFEYLKKNIKIIKDSLSKESEEPVDIFPLKYLVGKDQKGYLKKESGSKILVTENIPESKTILQSDTLDYILKQNKINNISLIKSDVDGNDYSVIDSAIETIKLFKPIIFFEFQTHNQQNHKKVLNSYLRTIDNLISHDYEFWSVFDNNGSLLLNSCEVNDLKKIMKYIFLQDKNFYKRTIWGLDLFTCTHKDLEIMKNSIDSYKKLIVSEKK